ncbi:MAG: hypothetical protein ACP5OA_03465 [Candidatus Woesearchaeota archaeon]
MNKVKDLSKDTSIVGLYIRIPTHLRAPTNLLNKGYILSFWDNSHDDILSNRSIGIWICKEDPKTVKKRTAYPCFLKNITDLLELQVISIEENKKPQPVKVIRNTTNIEA